MEYGRILVFCVLTLAVVNPVVPMKTLIISCALVLMASIAFAQVSSDTIVVAPGPSGLYFYHIVQKGESLASLSRQYGLPQNALARLNNTQNLQPYEMIKIPLAPSQIVHNGTQASNKNLKPLYHKVLKGETLFRVGKLYGDIPLDQLRQWNNLQGNNVGVGQYLIIGWLKKPVAQTAITQHTPAPADPQNAPNADSPATKPQAEAQPAPPVTEAASSSEGHAFLQEVIAAEIHHARNKRSLATETAVSRPLLSGGTPESLGPSSSDSQTGSNQVISQPLLTAAPVTAAHQHDQTAVQQPAPTPASNNSASTVPANGNLQPQVSSEGASPTPTVPAPAAETKPTATDQNQPADNGSQEAKDDNPFEKMLNKIAGKKQKASPSAATPTSSQPAVQTAASQTEEQPENAATKPPHSVSAAPSSPEAATPVETPGAAAPTSPTSPNANPNATTSNPPDSRNAIGML